MTTRTFLLRLSVSKLQVQPFYLFRVRIYRLSYWVSLSKLSSRHINFRRGRTLTCPSFKAKDFRVAWRNQALYTI